MENIDYKIIPFTRSWTKQYYITSSGEVYNYKGQKIKPKIENNYHRVSLSNDGDKKLYRIHRLVFMTYSHVNIDDEKVINHIDGNPTNNNIDNLEQIFQHQNITVGKKTKLSCEDILNILKEEGKTKYIADKYNVSMRHIRDIRNGVYRYDIYCLYHNIPYTYNKYTNKSDYTDAEKINIINENDTVNNKAKKYKVSVDTIRNWMKKYNNKKAS